MERPFHGSLLGLNNCRIVRHAQQRTADAAVRPQDGRGDKPSDGGPRFPTEVDCPAAGGGGSNCPAIVPLLAPQATAAALFTFSEKTQAVLRAVVVAVKMFFSRDPSMSPPPRGIDMMEEVRRFEKLKPPKPPISGPPLGGPGAPIVISPSLCLMGPSHWVHNPDTGECEPRSRDGGT